MVAVDDAFKGPSVGSESWCWQAVRMASFDSVFEACIPGVMPGRIRCRPKDGSAVCAGWLCMFLLSGRIS